MAAYRLAAAEVADWLHSLAAAQTLFWPRAVGKRNFSFLPLAAGEEVLFDHYLPTIVPPGRRLLPDDETLFTCSGDAAAAVHYQPPEPPPAMILAGVRPCDLQGIAQLDAVMAAAPADPLYLARRAVTSIIGMRCLAPCDDRCFCASVGTLDCTAGADILLTPLADGSLLVEQLSEQGGALLAGTSFPLCAEGEALVEMETGGRPQSFGRTLAAPVAELPELLRASSSSPVYDRHGERCFSCGTCNLVCPTCYCFEVRDEMALDGGDGRRSRTWDSCMIPAFAEVAGPHNFRPEVGERQRHRLKRKFEYLPERFELGSFCVGCGRCGRQCTAAIDILTMVNEIVAESGGAR